MILGIDWGEKRTGLALSDEKEKIAFPFKTIKEGKGGETIEKIQEICSNKGVDKIVLGVPKSFDGKEHKIAKKAKSFGKKISKELDIKVEFENEIFTSKIARSKITNNIDKRAASIILQSYLDKN